MTTIKQLESLVKHLNETLGSPIDSYTLQPDGKYKANIGNYHLSGAYGGYALHRIASLGGGVDDIFSCGHIPKRELYDRIHAYIDGINLSKSLANKH